MFTQFFGNYLLNEGLVTKEQLSEALELQKTTRLKLGVLAINAGYLTAAQVEEIHIAQQRVDKRFGDIAVSLGYLTEEKVNELLGGQKMGHLLLGQALVDKNYMTNAQFESALNSYKKANSLDDSDFTGPQNEKIEKVIREFYNFSGKKEEKSLTDYVSLTFKNIIRFIGDDFTPVTAEIEKEFTSKWMASQQISGKTNLFTAIEGNDKSFVGFASRYAQEEFTENDAMVKDCVSEFLNLHNGLYVINVSDETGVELSLNPQIVGNELLIAADEVYKIPICFPFGVISFYIAPGKVSL